MSAQPQRALRMAYVVASVAGVAFFVMSVALLGVWPKRVLDEQTRLMSPEKPLGLSASARRGRAIYSREGCAYCHTQQIRYLHSDMERFGAPTLAWETRLDYPHVWGTRRIGPDLTRIGGTRTTDWQYTHLFSPRAVVPDSVMPPYRAMFDGAPDRPRQEALDLVTYLDTLGRARQLAGLEGEAHAREACNCPDDEMAQMAFGGPLNTSPSRTWRAHVGPALPTVNDLPRGQQLYARHCATCHGAKGEGDGPGATALLPMPANLSAHDYSLDRLSDVLWNGVDGTAMPAWRAHPAEDRAAIAQAVQALRASDVAEPALPAHLLEIGQRVYAANCQQCHGERGDGSGTAAQSLPVAPASFTRQRPTLPESLRVLRNGIEGTPMAPWTSRLSDAELVAVAHYVRGFYAGVSAPGGTGQ